MKHIGKSGAVLAAAAFSLAMTGTTFVAPAVAGEMTIKCSGVNSCKGHSECATANSSCKGQNSCKGHGWVFTETEAQCADKGGKVVTG